MSAPKNPRITLDPGAYHALCIQAAIEQTTPGSLASRVILSYSQEAKQALQATGRMAPSTKEAQTPREVSFQDPTMGESQTPQEGGSHNSRAVVREVGRSPERETPIEGGKKVRLFQNPQALAKIKELWEGGQRNQAAIEQTTPGSLASRVILSYSQDAKQALQATGRKAPSVTKAQAPREISFFDPTMGESQTPQEGCSPKPRAVVREVGRSPEREAPKEEGKKIRLSQNPQALAKIKELWEGGQRNQADIARAIGYPKATLNENIRRMIKAGTLSPQNQ